MIERLIHESLARETGQPLLALSSLNNLIWFDFLILVASSCWVWMARIATLLLSSCPKFIYSPTCCALRIHWRVKLWKKVDLGVATCWEFLLTLFLIHPPHHHHHRVSDPSAHCHSLASGGVTCAGYFADSQWGKEAHKLRPSEL